MSDRPADVERYPGLQSPGTLFAVSYPSGEQTEIGAHTTREEAGQLLDDWLVSRKRQGLGGEHE